MPWKSKLNARWRRLWVKGLYSIGAFAYFAFDAMALAFCRVKPQAHREVLPEFHLAWIHQRR